MMVQEITLDLIREHIRNVPDFPKPGIQFKDITTVLKEPEFFSYIVDTIAARFTGLGISKVVCIESRGFILGGAIAARIGAGFVPIRKPGKLPAETFSKRYDLEYGNDSIEIHKDALTSDDKVLLHDDLLATGGTSHAAIDLIKIFNPKEILLSYLCELDFLRGREVLKEYKIHSLIHF
jgi:adenine phosphoribosyltransferase